MWLRCCRMFGTCLLPRQFTLLGRGDPAGDPRVLLFDAFHDVFRGVVCLVEVVDGTLRVGDRVTAASSGETYDVAEVRASEGIGIRLHHVPGGWHAAGGRPRHRGLVRGDVRRRPGARQRGNRD